MVPADLIRGRAVHELAGALGITVPAALGHLLLLLSWTWGHETPVVGTPAQVARAAWWDAEDAEALVSALSAAGLMELRAGEGWVIRGWQELLPDWVRARWRMRRTRSRRESPRATQSGLFGDVLRNTKRRTVDIEQLARKVLEAWNALGPPFPRARRLADRRLANLRQRAKSPEWLKSWREALRLVPTSAFLRGELPARNRTQAWVATLDWFLRPGTVDRLLEGDWGVDLERVRASRSPQERRDRVLARIRKYRSLGLNDVADKLEEELRGGSDA